MGQVYTRRMPVDIDAAVLANRRLSADYNVLAFEAPGIAARARPGQFVMIKPARGLDPLLRRPFSIFEVLRDPAGRPTGISIFNKRVGVGTSLLADVEPGARLQVLGPLGQPFEPIDPPAEAWMIAGGVGLAPFVTLAEALVARRVTTTLFYGARRAEELYCVDVFERLGVTIALSTEDGTRGVHGRVTVPLEAALRDRSPSSPLKIYACGPTPMMSACASLASRHRRSCHVSLEQVMGCGMGGCYSCVVPMRGDDGVFHHVRSCLAGPVLAADRIRWDWS
jgi:dihydroorotate dehydrogenase electron transfer subunit